MIHITAIRHAWPNSPGFCLKRPYGHSDYSFVHFATSVELYMNGNDITVPKHACIIYNPGTPQHFCCPDGMLHDWFHFVNVPKDFFERLDLPTDALFYPNQWSFITELVEEMENEFYAQRDHNKELIDLKTKELFIRLSRSTKNIHIEITDHELTVNLRQLRTQIIQNVSHNWTVAEMASQLMLSPSRFAHLYKSYFGTTPLDDLIRMRIDAAQNRLMFTNDTVCGIADSLGYRNTTHFCRQFDKFVGISPSQYRKNR